MKQRIPSFDDFIVESVFVPRTKFVFKVLNSIKKTLLAVSTTEEIDDVLNTAFNDHWILVMLGNKEDEQCLYPKWSIDAGNTGATSDGSKMVVTVTLGKHILEKIQNIKSNIDWNEFSAAFEATIAHEYVHKYQMPKIPFDTIANTWKNDIADKDYLMIKQEVMSFALQCVKEFMMHGYSPSDVLNKLKNPDSSTIPDESSDVWITYRYFFKPNDDTWKRFTKYMYEYCIKFTK